MSYAGELDFYRGLAATDRRDFDDARAAFRRATVENPHDARAWFELGNILDGRDAADAWARAAREDPWDLRATRRAAQTYLKLGDVDAAVALVKATIAAAARPDADYEPERAFLRAVEEQPR